METVFEALVDCPPGVGLTEINSFSVSPPLTGFCQLLVAEPDVSGTLELGALAPCAPATEPSVPCSDFRENLEIELCEISQVLYVGDKNKKTTLGGWGGGGK